MRGPTYVIELAKEFRKKPTRAEAILWSTLRDKQMDGVKFHWQRSFERYVLDFYAPSVKLVIEVDGAIHENSSQKEYDTIREDFFKEHGLKVIRFRNEQIMKDIEFCKSEIHKAIMGRIQAGGKRNNVLANSMLPPSLGSFQDACLPPLPRGKEQDGVFFIE